MCVCVYDDPSDAWFVYNTPDVSLFSQESSKKINTLSLRIIRAFKCRFSCDLTFERSTVQYDLFDHHRSQRL